MSAKYPLLCSDLGAKSNQRTRHPLLLFLALLALMGGNRELAQYNQLGSNNRLPKPPIKSVLLSAVAGDNLDASVSVLRKSLVPIPSHC